MTIYITADATEAAYWELLEDRAGGIQQEQGIIGDLWHDDQLAGLTESDCDGYLVALEQLDALATALDLALQYSPEESWAEAF